MVTKLFVPDRKIVVPKPPSYLKLNMAMDGASASYLFDKSRYRSHGDITGASWATGLHGKALDFDPALPSYVEIAAAYDQLNFTSEAFSGIIRVKLDAWGTGTTLFIRGKFNTDGWWWFVDSTGRQYFYTLQTDANQATFGVNNAVAIATHYTLGFSRDGKAVKLYINGVDDTLTSGTHINPLTSARTAKIGVYDDLSIYPFDGKIEFLRVFGGIALPASAHLAWHNALA